MRFFLIANLAALVSVASLVAGDTAACPNKLKPKVFIISTFHEETDVWRNIPDFDVFAQRIAVPGSAPAYEDAFCTKDGQICQITTGEGGLSGPKSTSQSRLLMHLQRSMPQLR